MDLNGLPVLLVEDDPDSREMMTLMLSLCGASVRAAASGHEALAVFDAIAPAVVVSDLSMPGLDGFELLGELQRRADVRAVAVTGHDHYRARALSAGFRDFLSKPVDPDVLCERVGRLGASH
jgi:CheY-like chemotaxis protein